MSMAGERVIWPADRRVGYQLETENGHGASGVAYPTGNQGCPIRVVGRYYPMVSS